MLFRNGLNQKSVVRAAAVLQQNCKDLPNIRNHSVLFFCVRHDLFQQLVEANRINEERPIYAIDVARVDVSFVQGRPIYAVSSDRQFVFWGQDHTWYIEMLCVLKCFVNPVL